MRIKTNHNWRAFTYRADVPPAILADQFSHLEEDDALDNFFCYRGWWYHVSDFMRCADDSISSDLAGWDGYASDSVFSGVVLKISRDGERYKVGTCFS